MTPVEFQLQDKPKAVGFYWVGGVGTGVGFPMTRKPWWLHRLFMRVVFGWQWREIPQAVD